MHLPVHARVPAGLSIDLLHNQPRRGVAAIDIPNLALLLVDATAHVPGHGEEVCQKSVAAPQVHEGLLPCSFRVPSVFLAAPQVHEGLLRGAEARG